jgi:hypothetical protein
VWRYLLGKNNKGIFNPLDDGGNGNIIDKDGNIYFTGSRSLIKLQIERTK